MREKIKSYLIRRWGLEQPDPFDDMARLLQGETVRTVVDAGASLGDTARLLRKSFPQADIWCFEPVPENVARLRQVPGIKIVEAAVAAESGTRRFYLNSTSGGHSLLDGIPEAGNYINPRAHHVGSTDVPTLRLDEWAKAQQIPGMDVLKIDVQGAEMEALTGAGQLLDGCRLVYTEIHYFPVYAGAPTGDEIWAFLKKHDFVLYRLYDECVSPTGQFVQGDALFVKSFLLGKQAAVS